MTTGNSGPTDNNRTDDNGVPGLPGHRGKLIAAGVLLAIPVIALMLVPTYSFDQPELFGFPFFFWYQFMWVFLCSAMTFTAYKLVLSARRGSSDPRLPKGGDDR